MSAEPPSLGLAVDLSSAGTARVIVIDQDGRVDPARIERFRDADTSTLTAVFVELEQRLALSFKRARVVIAVPGVPGRDVIPVVRSRWILSRTGLDQFFERPVTIVNDGAAKAWAALGGPDMVVALAGSGTVSPLPKLGRRVVVQYEDGLGVALVDRTAAGSTSVIETEIGHIGFSPREELDDRVMAAFRASRRPTSWEQALRAVDGKQSCAVTAALSPGQRDELFARWAAEFVIDAVLCGCAWDGVYLTGSPFTRLREPRLGKLFMDRVQRGRSFQRQFSALPCWYIEQSNAVLRGCAQILTRQHEAAPVAR